MKWVVYKKTSGLNPAKREISLEEREDHRKNSVIKKRMCKYFIKEKFVSKSIDKLKEWVDSRKETHVQKNCHILRHIDTATGENKVLCKILGVFYVIQGRVAYEIVYVNELKIQVDGSRIRHLYKRRER